MHVRDVAAAPGTVVSHVRRRIRGMLSGGGVVRRYVSEVDERIATTRVSVDRCCRGIHAWMVHSMVDRPSHVLDGRGTEK